MIKDFTDSRHKPLTWQRHLENERQEELKRQEEEQRPVREAEAALNDTTRKLYELEKGEVLAGRPDLAFTIPDSVAGKNMTLDEVREFNDRESAAFVKEHPEYYKSQNNRKAVLDYLFNQGIMIADRHCFAQAVERLRHFGLLEEKPAETTPQSEPAPAVEPQAEPEPQQDLVDGFDESGNPIRVTPAALWKMSSAQLKTFYRMWTDRDGVDRRAKFTRSRFA